MARFILPYNSEITSASLICAMAVPDIRMQDYTYELPDARIARFPQTERDGSRLLVWKQGAISHEKFTQISDYLSVDSLLVFNDTRVVPARLIFRKPTGAFIELFILQPAEPGALIQEAMARPSPQVWKCAIGNAKRWTAGSTLSVTNDGITLRAQLIDKEQGHVHFSWSESDLPFADVVRRLGNTPLPPYLRREAEATDVERYQTIYARNDGAVAAPTAGLHFTDRVMDDIHAKGIRTDYITLHVGAGTFLPVKSEKAVDHNMHEEEVVITAHLLDALLQAEKIVAVGTTSLRVLESIYWYGCMLAEDPDAPFDIPQFYPYQSNAHLSTREALELVRQRMKGDAIAGKTSIFIMPGYTFRIVTGLVTNFHQPGSTLLLLIAAFAGPGWKHIYDEALARDYRFLSYGDSSILLR